MKYDVLCLNVETLKWEIKTYNLPEYSGPIDIGTYLHLNEYESWREEVFHPKNVFFIGTGPFAGSKLFGVHRLVIVFRSPLSLGLHVSEMGGVGYKFIRSGINGISIYGKSKDPLIIFVEGNEDQINVTFEKLTQQKLFQIYENFEGLKGVYGFSKYLLRTYINFFKKNNARAIVVGEGGWKTRFGCLVSIDVNPQKEEIVRGSEDFAGRGGPGSVLAQAHGVAAIIIGGTFKKFEERLPRIFLNLSEFNQFYKSLTGRDFLNAVNCATVKYRIDPKIGAGGTFGANYPYYKEWLPTFCFNSIYLKREFRRKVADLIISNYWKPFKIETFEKSKTWKTCGEPCPVACKKLWKEKKVDYEPFHGVGPLIGVFNLELVSSIVDLIDQKGLDAIEIGHIVMFLLECVHKGLLKPEEIGISEPPSLDPFILNPKTWEKNGQLALEMVEGLINHKTKILKLLAEKGLRETIYTLETWYEDRITEIGIPYRNLALYQPYGEKGYMTPNFYWTKGFLIPIFVTGKYWTDYSVSFNSPEEMAKAVYERIVKELAISNLGICRFHRGWVEPFLDHLYEVIGISNFEKTIKNIYKNIVKYNVCSKALPKPLESEKAIDIFSTLAEELNVFKWTSKFTKNKFRTYLEWFERFYEVLSQFVEIDK